MTLCMPKYICIEDDGFNRKKTYDETNDRSHGTKVIKIACELLLLRKAAKHRKHLINFLSFTLFSLKSEYIAKCLFAVYYV